MKTGPINKENLVEHLINGEESAYTYLIDCYYDRLCDYASNLARDSFDSEDIVQNVMVKLWQKRKMLRPDISIKNYLYKSVYNEFVDFYRKHQAVTALEKKYIEGLEKFYSIKEKNNSQRLKAIIDREINLLPTKCKETFLLSNRDGLTYNEIAEYQNISVNTVENHMVKAFAILRDKLKDKIHNILFLLFKKGYLKSNSL